jgi:hypothetical protein
VAVIFTQWLGEIYQQLIQVLRDANSSGVPLRSRSSGFSRDWSLSYKTVPGVLRAWNTGNILTLPSV